MPIPEIIFETDHFLLVNKESGVLSQSSGKSDDPDLVHILSARKKSALHILTRLDRVVSGICLFSKSKSFTRRYLEAAANKQIKKYYLAIVEKQTEFSNSSFTHHFLHNKKNRKSLVFENRVQDSRSSSSSLTTLYNFDRYSLVRVEIQAGRFHQIRSHLAFLGHPVKGDIKYGARRSNPGKFIHLHAYQLELPFLDPDQITFTAGLPENDHLWELAAQQIKK